MIDIYIYDRQKGFPYIQKQVCITYKKLFGIILETNFFSEGKITNAFSVKITLTISGRISKLGGGLSPRECFSLKWPRLGRIT